MTTTIPLPAAVVTLADRPGLVYAFEFPSPDLRSGTRGRLVMMRSPQVPAAHSIMGPVRDRLIGTCITVRDQRITDNSDFLFRTQESITLDIHQDCPGDVDHSCKLTEGDVRCLLSGMRSEQTFDTV